MELEEKVTRAILEASYAGWKNLTSLDVAVVGGGPSGLTAAKYLADRRLNVAVFERHLSFGGGTWGGGMGHQAIVVEKPADEILRDFGVRLSPVKGTDLFTSSSVEVPAKLGAGAIDAGARIVTGVVAEDVVLRDGRVCGVVLNGYSIQKAGLHIDPLAVMARCVVDATGHEASVAGILARKNPALNISVLGEKSMWAEMGEKSLTAEKSEVFPGLFLTGMAVSAVKGSYRMGAIFGGMLLSGRICAEEISRRLREDGNLPK